MGLWPHCRRCTGVRALSYIGSLICGLGTQLVANRLRASGLDHLNYDYCIEFGVKVAVSLSGLIGNGGVPSFESLVKTDVGLYAYQIPCSDE